MKLIKQTLVAAAVPSKVKVKFEKLCADLGSDTSKMIRAFIELSISGSFIRHADKMLKAAKLIESFSRSMDTLIIETAEQATKRKRRKK